MSQDDISHRLRSHAMSPFFQAEVEAMIRAANLGPGNVAVDVGCGNGSLAKNVSVRGARVIGLDSSFEILLVARQLQAGGEWAQGSAYRLPLCDACADVLFAQHVIEHLPDPHSALAEWTRVLRPGALVVIVTPNARYPDPTLFADPTHVRIFDADGLVSLLRESGLRVLDVRTLFPYLGGRIVFGLRHRRLFSGLPPWRWLGRSLLAVAQRPTRPLEVD